MADRPEQQQADVTPLQSWMHRPMDRRRDLMRCLPELHVIVGMDAESSGVTIYSWEPTGGVHAHYELVLAARWLDPVSTTREALRIALNAITAALAEPVVPDAD